MGDTNYMLLDSLPGLSLGSVGVFLVGNFPYTKIYRDICPKMSLAVVGEIKNKFDLEGENQLNTLVINVKNTGVHNGTVLVKINS